MMDCINLEYQTNVAPCSVLWYVNDNMAGTSPLKGGNQVHSQMDLKVSLKSIRDLCEDQAGKW